MALPITPAPGIDVLVLAGDIDRHAAAIDHYADYLVPVVYVHGNPECYEAEFGPLVSELRQRAGCASVRFLEKEECVIWSVRFVGGCLWTDYHAYPLRFKETVEHARMPMLDHRKTGRNPNNFFQPEDAIAEHQAALTFWRSEFGGHFWGRLLW
ncbi:hypothetical protein P0D72_07840 [Paraburkholderia sediminicola]|uniref:hypothetical protein n=1 Tax=Paraburkholderia sediminicola TaxID=458836 RepID=UPI0038BB2062